MENICLRHNHHAIKFMLDSVCRIRRGRVIKGAGNREKLEKCIDENSKLINHSIKPANSYKVKRKKLQNQNGGALLTTLLTVGIPILADIIANAVR